MARNITAEITDAKAAADRAATDAASDAGAPAKAARAAHIAAREELFRAERSGDDDAWDRAGAVACIAEAEMRAAEDALIAVACAARSKFLSAWVGVYAATAEASDAEAALIAAENAAIRLDLAKRNAACSAAQALRLVAAA